MLVVRRYVLELDARWDDELPGIFDTQRRSAKQLASHAGFLLHLTQRGLVRQFVRLNVPAGRQPEIELAVVVEQDSSEVHDEHRDGEVTGGWGH